jgi:hypothetical protein
MSSRWSSASVITPVVATRATKRDEASYQKDIQFSGAYTADWNDDRFRRS